MESEDSQKIIQAEEFKSKGNECLKRTLPPQPFLIH